VSLRELRRLLGSIIGYFGKKLAFVESSSHALVWLLVAACTSFYSLAVYVRYLSFANSNPFDKAIIYQLFWNTLHGHFFYSSVNEAYYFSGGSALIYPFMFPVYAIYPGMMSLTVMFSLIISLGAVPVYRLGREKLRSGTAGLILAIAYLAFPAVSFMYLESVKDEIFSMTPLLFAFYYFERGEMKNFVASAFVSMFCKRNIPLVIVMFGIYGLATRRKNRWVLGPVLLGGVYFLVCLCVVMPYFRHLGGVGSDIPSLVVSAVFTPGRYGYLGGTFSEVVGTVITNPFLVLREMTRPPKISYLFFLFFPLGFLPLWKPKILLMSLPIFAENLLATFPPQYSIQFHYSAAIVPFLICAAIYAVQDLWKAILRRIVISRRELEHTILALLLIFVVICSAYSAMRFGAQAGVVSGILSCEEGPEARAAWDLIRMIPENASVSADIRLAPAVSQREGLSFFPMRWAGFDYVLIYPSSPIQVSEEEYNSAVYALLNDSDYHIVAIEAPYALFKRGGSGPTDERYLKLLLDPEYKMFADDPLTEHPARLSFLRAYSKQGWYGKETARGQIDFVWAGDSSNRSSMRIYPIEKSDYVLTLRVAPISSYFDGLPTQTVKVYVNRMFLEEVSLSGGWHTYRISLPESYTVSGVNEIEFHYGYTVSPFAYTSGQYRDARKLAVAFDYIQLFPAAIEAD
jgi:uncharacterized membrane protein